MSAAPAARVSVSLLGKLMAAVRPPFRVGIYVIDADDPVLGRGTCPVTSCDRARTGNGLCSAHGQRWRDRGRPPLEDFLTDAGAPLNGRRDLTRCRVPGCRYGSSGLGLCMRHRTAFTRCGHPDPGTWAAGARLIGPTDPGVCALPFCSLWIENTTHVFCKSHATRWAQLGKPDPDDYVEHCLRRGRDYLDLRGLTPQLRLEIGYAIQCRRDQERATAHAPVISWTIRQVSTAGVTSLLELTSAQWRDRAGSKSAMYVRFLLDARDAVEALEQGGGWEVEYPRDVWRLHRLPGLRPKASSPGDSRAQLRFDRIAQPWLRNLAKRWARWRLSTDLAIGTVSSDIAGVTRFSNFLTAVDAAGTLADVDRALLERYLAWLSTADIGLGARSDAITATAALLSAIRQHDWDPTLPVNAGFYPGDLPKRPPRLTRHLSEYVMAQVEDPTNLDRWTNPDGQLITLILIRCGLRASDACALSFDALIYDGNHAPYLRYRNHKMNREAAVPIDESLHQQVLAQQRRVAARWPGDHPHLFPAQQLNPRGKHPITYHSYRGMLNAWLTRCRIHDEHGDIVHLTPHQWRHTFATRLINRDVPQEIIRVLLDHESTQMTAHYARITDQTVRRRWEDATKVTIDGRRVDLDPDGPLAQAQWARTRAGLATQTLPHGYCSMPIQKTCPHANACLTCPVFLTGPEFLTELHEHRCRTTALITTAEEHGQTRVVQMNQQVLTNLDRILNTIATSTPLDVQETNNVS